MSKLNHQLNCIIINIEISPCLRYYNRSVVWFPLLRDPSNDSLKCTFLSFPLLEKQKRGSWNICDFKQNYSLRFFPPVIVITWSDNMLKQTLFHWNQLMQTGGHPLIMVVGQNVQKDYIWQVTTKHCMIFGKCISYLEQIISLLRHM